MIGIYQIKNKHNNNKYIGKSSNLFNRLDKHINELVNNKHINKYLQKDFNKYGYFGFNFEILDICNIDEMNNLEMKYIKELNPENDYNIIGLKENIKINKNKLCFEEKLKMIKDLISNLHHNQKIKLELINNIMDRYEWDKSKPILIEENLIYIDKKQCKKV